MSLKLGKCASLLDKIEALEIEKKEDKKLKVELPIKAKKEKHGKN